MCSLSILPSCAPLLPFHPAPALYSLASTVRLLPPNSQPIQCHPPCNTGMTAILSSARMLCLLPHRAPIRTVINDASGHLQYTCYFIIQPSASLWKDNPQMHCEHGTQRYEETSHDHFPKSQSLCSTTESSLCSQVLL